MKKNNIKFGGHMSVLARDEKPLISFGQDECIFCQYIFNQKAWVTPDGICPLIPKDEGMGIMVPVFVSREFGFGYHNQYIPEGQAQQSNGLVLTEEQRVTREC